MVTMLGSQLKCPWHRLILTYFNPQPWTLTLYGECGFMNPKTSNAAGCFTWKLLGRVVLSLAIGLFNGVIMWLVNGLIWSKDVYCMWVVAWRSLFVCVWFVSCSFVGYSSWAYWQTPRRCNQDLLFGGYSFHAEKWNSREMNMQIQQKLGVFQGGAGEGFLSARRVVESCPWWWGWMTQMLPPGRFQGALSRIETSLE
jgi:hypothetical protein